MNIDNCLQCFCVKFKRPKRSNRAGECECEIRGDEFIALPCSRSCTEIDGRHNDFCAQRLFELKGRGDRGGGGEGGSLRRSQGQETVWERSRLKVELTWLSVGVH